MKNTKLQIVINSVDVMLNFQASSSSGVRAEGKEMLAISGYLSSIFRSIVSFLLHRRILLRNIAETSLAFRLEYLDSLNGIFRM